MPGFGFGISFGVLTAMGLALGLPILAFGEGRANRLVHEKSPYLLQHAHNPVDWYPWGAEAFQKARLESKPIFLSIGYSTCHWCHVMEKESFSSPEIAAVMNEYFVPIKVDREERPDVDKVYMSAASAAGWGGGWPLSLWLTPDLKPFFGGTYFPPDAQEGRPGLKQVLERIAELWRTDGKGLESDANRLADALQGYAQAQGRGGPLDPEALENGFKAFHSSFAPSEGGFGGAPKFPMPVNQNFLLRYFARSRDPQALEMVLRTLRKMAEGGIYDQVGGGFHRYSTDDRWRLPHFEKMLYDNAQLAVNYLEAYQASKDKDLARVARETLDYALRNMAHPEGGFFSAEDADSPEGEGAFYLWTSDEVLSAGRREAGEIFSYRYGVEPGGNAGSDPKGEFRGKNILYAAHSVRETAGKFGKPEAGVREALAAAKDRLFELRSHRPHPSLDDKVLVSWNGLMISALAKGSQVLDDPKYLRAAEKAARFIHAKLYDSKTGRLQHRWREGESKVPGMADDYAFLAQGLIDLYEASFDPAWIEWAVRLTETQNALFLDADDGGLYMTAPGHDEHLPLRAKEDSDNVEPAAASVAALNLLRLAQLTDRKAFRADAEKTLTLFAGQMKERPRSLPQMLVALDYALSRPRQIVIAGARDAPDTRGMLRQVHGRFIPNKVLMVIEPGRSRAFFEERLPFLKGAVPVKGRATAYVCVEQACGLPASDIPSLEAILDGKPPPGR